ncbi:hypothetical protein ACFOD9_04870 [Novosphingobium bradum]|uniref:Uncharacterized protein n=1 Tax=Novosphingobium bradum TaxID=1737444 RepID=A0ABV7IRR1_9SPHN
MHRPRRHSPIRPSLTPAALAMALAGAAAGTGAGTLALAPPAAAQSASDFRLPPGTQPRGQGPVDPDNPATPAAATPAPTAPPSPTPAPPATPAPTPVPAPSPAARPATRPAPAPAQRPTAPSSAASPAAVLPGLAQPSLAAPTSLPPSISAPAPLDGPASLTDRGWLLPAALVAGLVGALATWALVARRRVQAEAEPEFVRPRPAPAQAVPEPAPDPTPASAPEAASTAADPLDLVLEPLRFSLTLVNATLRYRLVLANRTPVPLGPLHIAADMIAAHASISQAALLGQDGAGLELRLELRHALAALGPGERAELTGELRLPLADATPIHAGSAALLVPLVRLRVDGAGPTRTTALVVGEPPVVPGGPLRPFRLDRGPRLYAAIAQRTVATSA